MDLTAGCKVLLCSLTKNRGCSQCGVGDIYSFFIFPIAKPHFLEIYCKFDSHLSSLQRNTDTEKRCWVKDITGKRVTMLTVM